jgi:hypothetical protein
VHTGETSLVYPAGRHLAIFNTESKDMSFLLQVPAALPHLPSRIPEPGAFDPKHQAPILCESDQKPWMSDFETLDCV